MTTNREMPIEIAARMPGFLLRLGVGFVRMQRKRKSGVREFRRTLLESGLPVAFANRLAGAYYETGSPRNLLGRFGPRSLPGHRVDL